MNHAGVYDRRAAILRLTMDHVAPRRIACAIANHHIHRPRNTYAPARFKRVKVYGAFPKRHVIVAEW